jgi:hypothetical protein
MSIYESGAAPSPAPFPLLSSIKIFQQWGTRMCAHIRTTDNIPTVPLTLDLGDTSSPTTSDILEFMKSQAVPVSNAKVGACNNGSTADALLLAAGSQFAENAEWLGADADTVLTATPYFLFPWDKGQGVLPQEVFIGLCDLPEMLSLAYAPRFVLSSHLAMKLPVKFAL